jgi:hypothetical protein
VRCEIEIVGKILKKNIYICVCVRETIKKKRGKKILGEIVGEKKTWKIFLGK